MKVMSFCILLVVILISGCENPESPSLSLPYETKHIDIGFWNMTSDTKKEFSYTDYGLPGKDSIIGCFTSIISDDGNYIYPLDFNSAGYVRYENSVIVIGRNDGEFFATSTSFDDATINRGTLTVFYTNN